jgi:hypothetical protein
MGAACHGGSQAPNAVGYGLIVILTRGPSGSWLRSRLGAARISRTGPSHPYNRRPTDLQINSQKLG